ncbi:class I adenylate-forming enzyme family protein [Hoeflea sp. Naph1]|uniref:class I adenylate-forming enzyme family protein n=1 Tax=Hoeflea sp. Naph1 TaxID=3388653 RepID=UPI0039900914
MIPARELLENSRKNSTRTALVFGSNQITYGELLDKVRGVVGSLNLMVQPGDRVALLCTNSYQYIWVSLAIELAGAIRVPINIKVSQNEISKIIADCTPSMVLYEQATRHLVPGTCAARLVDVMDIAPTHENDMRFLNRLDRLNPEDICSINYTSGSTGNSKGVALSHRNWSFVYLNMLIDRDIDRDDHLAFIGPLTHAAWSYLFAGLLTGATNIVFAGGDTDSMLAYSRTNPITIVTCVPTTLMRIVEATNKNDPLARTLKWIGIGAAPVTQAQLDRAAEVFGNRIVINYGQTEAMMTCTYMDFRKNDKKYMHADYVGRPYTFAHIKIIGENGRPVQRGEVGEIYLRGSHTMAGYWNQPEITRETICAGYVASGDLGLEEEPGLFRLVGRIKDMIISGGFNIYPSEVETVVASYPGVDEVAVVGKTCETWGEKVVCFYSQRTGETVDEDLLKAYCKEQLQFKAPKEFHRLALIPKSPTGKIDKKVIRQMEVAAT